jgi:hypothetical protein
MVSMGLRQNKRTTEMEISALLLLAMLFLTVFAFHGQRRWPVA